MCRRPNADLIVVGSHGYGRIRSILLGSVAMGMLSEAPCSVLVARVKQETKNGELQIPVTVCH
jgi:nucleotide-binding universal stress UspA family protein